MMNNENVKPKSSLKSGRKPKLDKAQNCIMVRFTDEEYAKFLCMFEKTGMYAKAVFIKSRVFNQEFKVITVDSSMKELISILSSFHAQFRSVGVNINQITKIFQTRFSEKRAEKMLQDLLRNVLKLIQIQTEIIKILEKLKQENPPQRTKNALK